MEILPGVHLVPGTRLSRVYLVEDETLALVDAGLPWDVRRVLSYIQSIGRRADELRLILMTHSHPDHAGSALSISRRTGAQIVAHVQDTKARALSYMGVFNSLALPLPFLQRTPVSRTLSDGEILPPAGGVRVIHTPGHTPGSVCYLLEKGSVLFSGDTLFSDGRRVSRSVPFPGSNKAQYRKSLDRLAALQFDVLCGGHGVPLVGGASDRLRELIVAKPDPPSWREFIMRAPRRWYYTRHLGGEDR